MKKLNRMLFREILKTKWQFIAAAAVIFAGIAIFSATIISYRNLKDSMDYSYEKYRFADYSAETYGYKISPGVIDEVRKVDGVKSAMGRISADAAADIEDETRVPVRIVSVPDRGQPEINGLYVLSGNYLSNGTKNQCLVSSRFGKYYGHKEKQNINTLINSKDYSFEIAGLVSGPEFFKLMKSPSSISASDGDFGLIFIKESDARNIFGTSGMYNQLHVIFKKDADSEKTMHKIEDILKPYGLMTGTPRGQQLSHIMISDDVEQVKAIATVLPIVFLIVAAAIIYIMQRRIISNQRTMIGSLKALGYTDRRILWHYIKYSVILSFVGAVPAIIAGQFLGKLMTLVYLQLYDLPELQSKIYFDTFFIAIALSLVFCTAGGYNAAKRVLKIEPAQAMRSEAPKAGKRILLEKLGFIWRNLSFSWKVTLRNIFRNRQRSFLTIMGFMFTVILFVVMFSLTDTVDYVIDLQFNVSQKQDFTVNLKKPMPYNDSISIKELDGIGKVEPLLESPVEINKGTAKKQVKLIGLDGNSSLYKFTDKNGKSISVPQNGILIAKSLANKLAANVGDEVNIKYFFGDIKEGKVKVAGIIRQAVGFDCYMNLNEMSEQLKTPKTSTSLLIQVSKSDKDKLEKVLQQNPLFESVESKEKAYNTIKSLMALIYYVVGFMVVFCVIMGFSIIFITTIINLTERGRELASMKVLGYTDSEIGRTLLRENIILGIIALIPGLILGQLVCGLIIPELNSRIMYLEAIVSIKTYIITALSVLLYILLAQLSIRKSIKKLNMVEVLKNKEG